MSEKTVPPLTDEEIIKGACIMHAIEVDSAFKLYSYRIIDHKQYIERTTNLVGIFLKQTKPSKKNGNKKT